MCGLPHFSASFGSAAEAMFVTSSPVLSDLLWELLRIPGDCQTEKIKGKLRHYFFSTSFVQYINTTGHTSAAPWETELRTFEATRFQQRDQEQADFPWQCKDLCTHC